MSLIPEDNFLLTGYEVLPLLRATSVEDLLCVGAMLSSKQDRQTPRLFTVLQLSALQSWPTSPS